MSLYLFRRGRREPLGFLVGKMEDVVVLELGLDVKAIFGLLGNHSKGTALDTRANPHASTVAAPFGHADLESTEKSEVPCPRPHIFKRLGSKHRGWIQCHESQLGSMRQIRFWVSHSSLIKRTIELRGRPSRRH